MSERDTFSNGFFEEKSWRRNLQKGMFGGVLSGFADYMQWDVVLVRLAFLLLTFFSLGFLGLFIYFIMWVIIPVREGDEAVGVGTTTGRIFKYGCLGTLFIIIFPLLIIGLLLIIPIIYLTDFSTLISDPNFFACDDITWDIRYNPNISQLIVGTALAFLFPIISVLVLHGRTEIWGITKSRAYLFVGIVALSGVMMIVSALTAS